MCRIPGDQYHMSLQGSEFARQHFMVCVSGDEHSVVEIPELCHFVSVEGEPCVDTFFDYGSVTMILHFAEMLVMEYYVILDQSVLEFPFLMQKVLVFCILDAVSSSVVMTFSDRYLVGPYAVHVAYLFKDEVEETSEIHSQR